jgi:hypothetical protein
MKLIVLGVNVCRRVKGLGRGRTAAKRPEIEVNFKQEFKEI